MVTQRQLKAIWSRSSRERSSLWQHSSSGPGGDREVALRIDRCPIRYPQKCIGFAVRVAQKWGVRSGHGCWRGDERGGRLGAIASASLQADAPSQAAWGGIVWPDPERHACQAMDLRDHLERAPPGSGQDVERLERGQGEEQIGRRVELPATPPPSLTIAENVRKLQPTCTVRAGHSAVRCDRGADGARARRQGDHACQHLRRGIRLIASSLGGRSRVTAPSSATSVSSLPRRKEITHASTVPRRPSGR